MVGWVLLLQLPQYISDKSQVSRSCSSVQLLFLRVALLLTDLIVNGNW